MRRAWLQLPLLLAVFACGEAPRAAPAPNDGPRVSLDLSGEGWRLWLDRAASVEGDELLAPPVDLARVAAKAPAIGWEALASPGADRWTVSVPGTVEQFTWPTLAAERRADGERAADDLLAGDYVGVSWWSRGFEVPADVLAPLADGPRRLELQFDAVRQRAEVWLNGQLVGCDSVGNTPFACDVTAAVRAGRNELAVRVSDPGGNFDWRDHEALAHGAGWVPSSHGFGGITGPVRLVSTGPVRLADAWIVNTADPRTVELHVEIENAGTAPATIAWTVDVRDAQGTPLKVDALRAGVACAPGRTEDSLTLPFPGAALWSLASPALHTARFELTTGPDVSLGLDGAPSSLGRVDDALERRFGFRSFTIDDTGGAAVLRLNGERIVLRSAISWGYWPVSGLVPTAELARRQVETAKSLGLNMLNHHRAIAAPGLLDVHDELGLLACEEPGGYASEGGDDACRALAREKLLRMVRRDRSHPSLVIANLINEETVPPTDAQRQDLLDAHALDPDLVATFTSAWSPDGDDPLKLHVRPGESVARTSGWWDYHNAAGPGVWRDVFWSGPANHRRRSENTGEIVFWGEEGANASPPRLPAMSREAGAGDAAGWDGEAWRAWAAGYEAFLDEKGLRTWFPTLDSVTVPLANVAYDYQARSIDNVRLGDVTDGYVVNGWESEVVENHSGIVDLGRHPKGDVARLAEANAPVRLVPKLRSTILTAGEWASPTVQAPSQTLLDVYLVDETPGEEAYALALALRDGAGQALWSREEQVRSHGGDVFGEPLVTELLVTAEVSEGPHVLEAELRRPSGEVVARGRDELWVVDWRSQALPVNGAVLESNHAIRNFLSRNGRPMLETYFEGLRPVDFVLVGDFDPEPREVVPAAALRHVEWTGEPYNDQPEWRPNLTATIGVDDGQGARREHSLQHPQIDFDWSKDPPAAFVPRMNYEVTWEGVLVPPESGRYAIHTLSDDGVRVWIDTSGDTSFRALERPLRDTPPLIDNWEEHEPTWDRAEVDLAADKAYPLRIDYSQREGGAQIRLCWTLPSRQSRVAERVGDLLRRAREDGTRLVILDKADRWAKALADAGALESRGQLEHGKYWLGGGFLAREHQLFNGLPTGALGREWQEMVQYGAHRFGLRLSGEECLAFCVSDHQFEPATAVGIVPCGKGQILFSTLDVLRSLNNPPGPADATRRYFTNVVQWGGSR